MEQHAKSSFLPSPVEQFQQDPSGRWRFQTRLCLLSPSEGIPPARWWAAFQKGCWNWLFQSSSARPHWINCYFWKEENREREELLLSLKKANEVNHISYWKMQLFICRYYTRLFSIYNFFRAYKLELFKMGQLLLLWTPMWRDKIQDIVSDESKIYLFHYMFFMILQVWFNRTARWIWPRSTKVHCSSWRLKSSELV